MLDNVNAAVNALGCTPQDCHPELPLGGEYRQLKPGGGSLSVEEAVFMAGLIFITRPDVVIELGTSRGCSAVVLAAACKDLNKGEVITVDLAWREPPTSNVKTLLGLPLTYVLSTNSLDYLDSILIDPTKRYLVFSDTDIPVRPTEVQKVIDLFPSGTVIAVHDTADKHPFGPMKLTEKVKGKPIVQLPSPRGLSVLVS